ncbi:MAG: hypothetical protein J1E85_10550 [Ruminococcus sp.]|nr:hypothetical protein [Ruminococcus sp.]
MDNSESIIQINNVASLIESEHTSSTLQPDTLFHFMERVDWLIEIVQNKCISERYCQEDIAYLKISGIERLAIPMRCFCDIRLHDLQEHIQYYGACGIAFPKHWGMQKGIQPIHYINPNSKLTNDLSEVFNDSLLNKSKRESRLQKKLKNYMLHEIMYTKPDSGNSRNRISKKEDRKCFTDECEWRFIPDLSPIDYPTLVVCDGTNNDYIAKLTESLSAYREVSLQFEYEDIKYLIVENNDDFVKLSTVINELQIKDTEKLKLISKIIIWENSRGDF